jgi:hypothetical protein
METTLIRLNFTLLLQSLTSCLSIFILLLWPFLDIENVLLEPVARRQDCLPPLPPIPSPPSKAISKRHDR